MAKKIDHEISELYQMIAADIARMPAGSRVPSYAGCMKKYNCSRRVLEYVFQRLAAEGKLEIVPRQGAYVSRKTAETCRVILVHTDWPQEYQAHLNKYFIAELATLPGVTVAKCLVPPVPTVDDFCSALSPANGDIGIVCCNFHHFSQQDAARLLNCGIPLIFTENHMVCRAVNLIDSMPEYTGMLAADYLYKRGHRKIALVNSDAIDSCLRREIDGFLCYLALQGVQVEMIDCRHPACESSLASAEEKGLSYLKKNGMNFTAAFLSSPFAARGFCNALNQLGYSVPEDVSIIANSEVPSAAKHVPPLTTISRDFAGYASTAKKMVKMLRSGKHPGIIPVPSFIVERQSVRDISKKQ